MCRFSSNFPSGNTQEIRDNHKDRTNCVFPPSNLPRRTQAISKRSHLSLNLVFWSEIQCGGSRRQPECSRANYVALPVVKGPLSSSPLHSTAARRSVHMPPGARIFKPRTALFSSASSLNFVCWALRLCGCATRQANHDMQEPYSSLQAVHICVLLHIFHQLFRFTFLTDLCIDW